MKHTLKVVAAVVALSLGAAPAFSAAIGSSTVRDRVSSLDGNGRQISMWDLGAKVFEVMNTSAATLLTDEAGVAPVAGQLLGVCVESGAVSDWTVLFDSGVTTGLIETTTGRRLMPPILASTTVERCVAPIAGASIQFTKGIVIKRTVATGSAYVYWRPIGGR